MEVTKQTINPFTKKDFNSQFSAIVKTFATAAENAQKLNDSMLAEIDLKNKSIEKLNSEITEINSVKEKTNKFITNITALIS